LPCRLKWLVVVHDDVGVVERTDQFEVELLGGQSLASVSAVQATTLTVRIERTREPVWPEDEAAELAQPGAVPVPPLDDAEADAVLRQISVKLPDRLQAVPVSQSQLDRTRAGSSGVLAKLLMTEQAPPGAVPGDGSAERLTQPEGGLQPKLDLAALLGGDSAEPLAQPEGGPQPKLLRVVEDEHGGVIGDEHVLAVKSPARRSRAGLGVQGVAGMLSLSR
jgi:hypothetical protein